ncbi:hypothetical protein JW930_01405 [Candidatus Woesearchaeota archaeon]|nr:hypothetical protein [Candidatus Woesearchaeota archaeon]
MKENQLLIIALLTSITGLVILAVLSHKIEVTDTTIEKITKEEIGNQIKVTGKIIDIEKRPSYVILEIEQPSLLEVIVFDNNSDFSVGNVVKITGRVQKEKEIVADEIQLVIIPE